MAISFTSARKFSTGNIGGHNFSNNLVASQSFKLRVDSATPGAVPYGLNTLRRNIFCFQHYFITGGGPTVGFVIQLNGANGTVNHTFRLTVGTVYVFCVVWDGNNHVQKCWANGVPATLGSLSGTTSTRIDPVELGPDAANSAIAFTLDDYNAWDNYALTQADAQFITNNGDPTTIGTGASWRCRWTMAGTTGLNAAVGDAGLKNAYGTGAADGSDFRSVTGAGTAIYADPLVWAPTVTPHAYAAGSGKNIGVTFTGNLDGLPQVPSQLLSMPTLKVNGVDQGALVRDWGGHKTGAHSCMLFSTPGSPPLVIGPSDVVELTAPPAWANTPAGPVAALSGAVDNRVGRSSVGVDGMTKTLRMGVNLAPPGGLEYYPFANAKYKTANPYYPGKLHPGHGYEVVNQPCEAGKILVVWDATHTGSPGPATFSLQSNYPTRVTVTHDASLDVSPPDGIGYVRAYDVAYVPNSDYESAVGGSGVGLNYDDPAFAGTPNYDNLWIYLAGEWDIVDGAAVFDRSDRLALSRIFTDRVRGAGSFRAVDMTACGGSCLSFPDPELLPPDTSEFFWGYNPVTLPNVGFLSAGPVDPAATPWIYSPQFKQDANAFTATLGDAITTTPAAGTHETYTFPDAGTAPLMKGLEVKVDDEVMRILAVSGSSVTLYRGSNGTVPATHSPGPVTVYGRVPITAKVRSDGTAPFTAPVWIKCAAPHGLTTANGYYPQGTLPMTMADGTAEPNLQLSRFYATGPDSFMSIWSGWYPNKPAGTKPSRTYTLNPSVNYMQRLYFPAMPLSVYCDLVSRFPDANLHVNAPLDACDDMFYFYAWTVRDNFPAGRKIYCEYANEPWNFAPPFQAFLYCTDMGQLALPPSLQQYHDYRDYYPYRATRFHEVMREVFTAAGRGNEIVGIVNCQMNSGSSQVTPYLNAALSLGRPLDAVACAPYYSVGAYASSVTTFNAYDDDQAAELLLHDITYDVSGNIVPWSKDVKAAVNAYNAAHAASVAMIGYEGGIEYAAPTGATNRDARSHDVQYNPNFYNVEQGWYKILQDVGFDHLHIYALGIGWGPPGWGIYHMRTQPHSRGDGLNGAYDNRSATITPGSHGYIGGSTLRQDRRVDSVRGQALRDWLDSIDQGLVGVAGLDLQSDAVAATVIVDTLTQGTADTALQSDSVAAAAKARRTTKAAPFNATMTDHP